MKKRKGIFLVLLLAAILTAVWFVAAAGNVNGKQQEAGRQALEEGLRRAAVACYAAEGAYPPTVAYLEEHYGLQVDYSRYYVFYEVFAENLMPEITVIAANG